MRRDVAVGVLALAVFVIVIVPLKGIANAFGFALCGLIGLSRIDRALLRKDQPLCVSP